MTCPICHAPVLSGAVFCDHCGINLAQAAALAAAQPVRSFSVQCTACGAENEPGSLYCDTCGAALKQPPASPQVIPAALVGQSAAPAVPAQAQARVAPAQPPASPIQAVSPQASIPGRLVLPAANAALRIPAGKAEIIIGREDPVSGIFPDVNLDPYDALNQGVSRLHAKLSIQGGKVYIEDLKAANYTHLRGQRLAPGQKYPLNNGDELILGRLRLVYYAS